MPKQAMAMLDAPFYTRAAVTTQVNGELVTGVHEGAGPAAVPITIAQADAGRKGARGGRNGTGTGADLRRR